MFVSPENSHVGILTPNVMLLGDGALGGLGHEGGALGNGFSALVLETSESPQFLLPSEDTQEV